MSAATASPAVKPDLKPKVEGEVKPGGGGGGNQNNRGPKRKRGESPFPFTYKCNVAIFINQLNIKSASIYLVN